MRGEEQLQQRREVATAATNSLVFNAFIWLQVRPLMRPFLPRHVYLHLLVILLKVLRHLIGLISLKLPLPFACCLHGTLYVLCLPFDCCELACWPLLQSTPVW